ncbi:hypothetical protein ACI65C_006768 [Semiaphis heraclei]
MYHPVVGNVLRRLHFKLTTNNSSLISAIGNTIYTLQLLSTKIGSNHKPGVFHATSLTGLRRQAIKEELSHKTAAMVRRDAILKADPEMLAAGNLSNIYSINALQMARNEKLPENDLHWDDVADLILRCRNAHSMNALSDQCHSVKLKELTSSDGVSDDETIFSCSSNNFKEKSMFYVDFEKNYRTVYDTCQITDDCELLPNNEYYCESFAKKFLNLYLPFTYMWTRLMMPQEIMSKYSVKTITNAVCKEIKEKIPRVLYKRKKNQEQIPFRHFLADHNYALSSQSNRKCKKSSSEWDDSQNCCPGDPGNILIEQQWQKRSKTVQSHFSHTNIQRLSYDWQYKSTEIVVQYDFDKNGQDKVSNLPRYSNHLFADINYYSSNLSEQYVVGMYSSEGYKDVTLYGEDFRTLLNNSWLNGAVIDALLLTYVTNEIGYIPVKGSNSIWSSTKVQIAKFDWTKYCVLFLPINPEDPLNPKSGYGDLYLSQLKKMSFSICDNEKAKDLLHKIVLRTIEYSLQNDSYSCGVFVLFYCSMYSPMFSQSFSKEVNITPTIKSIICKHIQTIIALSQENYTNKMVNSESNDINKHTADTKEIEIHMNTLNNKNENENLYEIFLKKAISTVNKIHLIEDPDHLREAIKKIDALNAFIDATSKQSAPNKEFIKHESYRVKLFSSLDTIAEVDVLPPENHNDYGEELKNLRWYILAKNSNFVFTKNHNSENDLEESLLNNSECLTSEVVQDSELLPDSFSLDTHDTELVEIELTFGTAMENIPSENLALLEEFETANEPFDDLEIQCVEYITG